MTDVMPRWHLHHLSSNDGDTLCGNYRCSRGVLIYNDVTDNISTEEEKKFGSWTSGGAILNKNGKPIRGICKACMETFVEIAGHGKRA